MSYDYEWVRVTPGDGGVVELVLNRPDKRNAITHEMDDELMLALDELELDDAVRAVILRGEGKVFSAGHDLGQQAAAIAWMAGGGDIRKAKSFHQRAYPHHVPSIQPRLPRPWYFRKPLIGAVHEYVGPYAMALVACCDFTIAGTGTRFSGEVARGTGFVPGIEWVPMYAQLPMRVLAKLWLLGGWMDAEQALEFQFVQRVVAPEEVLTEAHRWAKQAALTAPEGFAQSKDVIRRSFELLGLGQLGYAIPRFGPPMGAQGTTVFSTLGEKGLAAALVERNAGFDEDVSRV